MSPSDDQWAIRDLLATYCHRCDDGEFDDLVELFSSSATLVVLGTELSGRSAIGEWLAMAQPLHRRGKHLTVNAVVEIGEGDIATAVSDFMFARFIKGELRVETVGRYTDRLNRSGDGWVIDRRVVEMLGDPAADG